MIIAAESHPACMQGFFQAVIANYADEPKATEVFRTGEGIPWTDHSACLSVPREGGGDDRAG